MKHLLWFQLQITFLKTSPFCSIKEKYPQRFEIATKILRICLKLDFHHIIQSKHILLQIEFKTNVSVQLASIKLNSKEICKYGMQFHPPHYFHHYFS